MSHQQIPVRKPRAKQERATGNGQESMNSRPTNGRTIFQKGRNMEFKTLGNTGLLVSRLCLGTMTFGPGQGIYKAISAVGQAGADELVKTSIDGGINFFDTADNYTEGESEKILGQSLKNLKIARQDVVIATKVYSRVGPGGMTSGLLAVTLWTVWRPVSAVCRPTISTCTRSMATIR